MRTLLQLAVLAWVSPHQAQTVWAVTELAAPYRAARLHSLAVLTAQCCVCTALAAIFTGDGPLAYAVGAVLGVGGLGLLATVERVTGGG